MRTEKGTFKPHGKNEVEYVENYALVWVVDKQGQRKRAYKVDIEDLDLILTYRWSEATDGYAKSRTLKMHRVITGAQKGQIVDHINQDVTDNRKSNLRFVTHAQNMRNSHLTKAKSGYKHIRINQGGTYAVEFRCEGVKYYSGNIATLEEALQKRNEMHKEVGYNV